MKKIISLLLILGLILVLFVSCGENGNENESTTPEETTTIESDPLVDGMTDGEDTDTGWGEVNPLT